MEYHSAIKRNTFESVLMRWMNLEPIIQSEVTQKFSSVQSRSRVWFSMTAAHQASLSISNSQNLLKLMSIESVMPSNHLILCHPFLLLPSIFPNIRVFCSERVLCIRWPKYCSFTFTISPSSEHPGLISFRMDSLDLRSVQGTNHHQKVYRTQMLEKVWRKGNTLVLSVQK